jgi:O-antigen ligase
MIFFYILIGVMPLERHPLWSRAVGDLTVFKYLGAICLLYAFFYLTARRASPEFLRTWQARLFLTLFLLATLSYVTKSLARELAFNPFLSYLSFLLLFFVVVTVVDSLRRLRWVLFVAAGSVAFASLYVIREWQEFHNIYAGFRPGWVVGDPNYFTVSALLTLPIAYYMMLGAKVLWERIFCAGCMCLTLVAVTLGASRGGFLGLMAAFVFVVWHSRQRLRNLAFAGALVLLILVWPIAPVQRLLHPAHYDEAAQESRLFVWRAGLRMIESHPITGIGLGNFKLQVDRYEPESKNVQLIAHNAFIEIASEMGLPALLIFLGILFSSYRTLGRMRVLAFRARQRFVWNAALSLQAGLLGSAVAIFFVSAQYQKLLWLAIFLSICMPAIVRQNSKLPVEGEI